MKDASRYYLDELFAELVELPTEDREKALGGLTGDDPTLSRQLRALLAASEPPRPTLELREGLELDRYRLGERLGAGASASVWKAWDTHLHAWTALKLLHPRGPASQSALDMVMNEARAASQILSDHVVRVKAAGLLPGGPPSAGMHYIEMQLCAERRPRPDGGEELVVGSTVAGDPPRDTTEALRFIREAALGVDAAHRVGVLHRDLKPANLLLLPVSRRVLVTDFGLATPQLREPAGTDTPSTETVTVIIEGGHVVGTPAYMSPEQARGEAPTRASDVYALGATLYSLLSGAAPYQPSGRHSSVPALDVIAQVREGPPRPLQATARVARVVQRAMARQPRDRYPTALALADELGALLAHYPTSVDGPNPALRVGLFLRRNRELATAGAVLSGMLLVFSGAVWSLQQTREALQTDVAEARERRAEAEHAAAAAEAVRSTAETERDQALVEAAAAAEAREAAREGQTAAEARAAAEIQARDEAEKRRGAAEVARAEAERRLRDALLAEIDLQGRLLAAEQKFQQEHGARQTLEVRVEAEQESRRRAEQDREEAERALREAAALREEAEQQRDDAERRLQEAEGQLRARSAPETPAERVLPPVGEEPSSASG